MTRILFVGDLASTGFGTVTQDLGRGLLAIGHDVRFLSQNELGELEEPFKSRTLVVNAERSSWHAAANRGELHVSDLLEGRMFPEPWAPEAVIITSDFYAARGLIFLTDDAPDAFKAVPTFHYCPVEGVGLPPSWKRVWDIVHPVAMSEFGANQIAKVTGTRPEVIYHGVSTADFWPVSAARPIRLGDKVLRSKEDCRAYFGWPRDMRLCLRVDTNMPRKRYPSLLRAMSKVMATRPDVALMWHCRSSDEGGDLRDEVSKYPPSIRQRMGSTGYHDKFGIGMLKRPELNALYNAASLYVTVSAEGFGLTIAEAAACGVPIVGLDYSSVPEVIGPAGRVAPVEYLVDNGYGHFWAAVDEAAFAKITGDLLDDPRELALLGAKGPYHVSQNFRWDTAAQKFSDLIAATVPQEAAA